MNVKGNHREAIRLPLNEYGESRNKKLWEEIKTEYPKLKDFLNKLILSPHLSKQEKERVIALADELDNIWDRLEFGEGIP
jgi:hypothetical protein